MSSEPEAGPAEALHDRAVACRVESPGWLVPEDVVSCTITEFPESSATPLGASANNPAPTVDVAAALVCDVLDVAGSWDSTVVDADEDDALTVVDRTTRVPVSVNVTGWPTMERFTEERTKGVVVPASKTVCVAAAADVLVKKLPSPG
jgi:hypothetical protein